MRLSRSFRSSAVISFCQEGLGSVASSGKMLFVEMPITLHGLHDNPGDIVGIVDGAGRIQE